MRSEDFCIAAAVDAVHGDSLSAIERDYAEFCQRVDETADFLRKKLAMLGMPETLIVLGTGLGAIAERLEDVFSLSYSNIPHFPKSTVTSHQGRLCCGRLGDKTIAVMQGRFHYYEGYSTRFLTMPIRVFGLLGCKRLVVTGAAGGLNPGYQPGTIMLLNDHLNFIPDNPLRGPNKEEWGERFPDMSKTYSPELLARAWECAEKLALPELCSGVYAAVPGPSLETPAETRFLRNSGADAVGMSVVPEVIVGRHCGMEVLGIAAVANVNDPDNFKPILIEDVVRESTALSGKLEKLIVEVISG